MNIEDVLIMIRDKESSELVDKTKEVAWFNEDEHSFRVKFVGNSTFYHKSFRDMFVYENPVLLRDHSKIYFKGHKLEDLRSVIKFDRYLRVIYSNGQSTVYKESECRAIPDKTSPKHQWILRFNYFKTIAKLLTYDSSFLDSQYNTLDINESTILFKYLNKYKVKHRNPLDITLYPFGLNLSQKIAVEKAFEHDVSVIEGPPGTGKTQTILNIIANAVYKQKSIAVISNNNAAIENVREKLTEYNLDFLTALLGNKGNKIIFFDQDINKPKPLADLKNRTSSLSRFDLSNKLKSYRESLPRLYGLENSLAALKNTQLSLKTEYKHYQSSNSFNEDLVLKKLTRKVNDSDEAIYLRTTLNYISELSFFDRLKIRFKYKLNVKKLTEKQLVELSYYLTHKYYQLKFQEIDNERKTIEKILNKENFVQAQKNCASFSMDLLKIALYSKYKDLPQREFSYEKYRYDFKNFINEYPIILSTSHALIASAGQGYLFDYVIIDEASQTELLSSILALSCARNIIVVGDTKQLPHIENERVKNHNDKLMQMYNLDDCYNYLKHNILTSTIEVFSDAPKTLLKEHYRCHPKIINFCNEKYYDNELVILTKSDASNIPLNIIKTVPGNHARTNPNGSGQYNQREIDEIVQCVSSMKDSSIGIITPFRIQAEKLKEVLNVDKQFEVDTVHKFQGRAKDIIILSTVANDIRLKKADSEREDFVSRNDLLNVAVSRAKKELHLIVSDGVYHSKNNAISDLIQYIEYHSEDSFIKEGTVKSIYDMLYSVQKKELEVFREKYRKTEYDSENLTLKLIGDILEENNFKNLAVALHSPLDDLITNYQNLSKEELDYVRHPWTHVDFLIYNTLTKKSVLVIEVDGVYYHEQNEKQVTRDEIKNKALKLNKVPLLRLKTNESSEKERIIGALFS